MPIISQTPNRASADAVKASIKANGYNSVRRPTRGIVLKEDTFATLRVVARNNSSTQIVDGGSNIKDSEGKYLDDPVSGQRMTDIYSNFLIQSVQEERAEKAQILETFGEAFIFLFGERARMLNISGALLNTFDFNWKQEWMENYERFLRGTRCVENDSQVFLAYDNTLVSGYLLTTSIATQSAEQNFVQFNFQMFVTGYTLLGNVGSPYASPDGAQEAKTFPAGWQQQTAGRPDLIGGGLITEKSIASTSTSVFDGLQAKISALNQAISSTKKFVNGFMLDFNAFQNGDIIRVPVGFEGSLVFDDSEYTAAQLNQANRIEAMAPYSKTLVVSYTTFADNEDEYVGKSMHYGSAVQGDTGTGGVVKRNWEIESDKDSRTRVLLAKAQASWRAAGLNPPPDWYNPVSRFLLKRTIGIVTAGVTKAWQTGSLLEGMKAAGKNAAFGSGVYIGTIATGVAAINDKIQQPSSGGQAPASASTVRQVVANPRLPASDRKINP